MNPIEQQVLFSTEKLLEKGERVLVAYSGGPDSTFLLVILSKLWPDTAAVYVNHNLRGKESEAEEQFVRQFCTDRKIPLFVEQIHWRKKPANLEESARKRRYRHFAKVAAEQKYNRVALAHHRDDLVETFLLRLIRGSGPTGLSGLAPHRGIYIRPLLAVSREQIEQYLNAEKIPYVTDSSNSDLSIQRNRIRLELLPYLQTNFNPAFPEAIARTSRWIHEQNELLTNWLSIYDDIQGQTARLMELPEAVQKALLRRWLRQVDPNLRPEARLLEKMLQAIRNKENMELPGFLMVKSSGTNFSFSRKSGEIGFCEIDVPAPGSYFFPPADAVLDFSLVARERISEAPLVASIDAEKATFPLHVRNWKKGDSFHPLGMSGRKKLSDFWIDRKVPRSERKRIPLVFKEDDLVWIAGYHIDHQYRITGKTRKLLRISLAKHV